jgi:hypothetical protein
VAYRRGDQSCTHAAQLMKIRVSSRQVRTFSERACGCGAHRHPSQTRPTTRTNQSNSGWRACRVPLPPQRHGNGRPESHKSRRTAPRARSTRHPRTVTTTRARTKRTQQPRSPVGVGGWRKGRVGSGRGGGGWFRGPGDFSHPYGPTCASILRLSLLGAGAWGVGA